MSAMSTMLKRSWARLLRQKGDLLGAAIDGDLEDVRSFLQKGADPNARGSGGLTALVFAITTCDDNRAAAIATELLAAGADPDARVSGGTALTRAAVYGKEKTAYTILNAGGDPNLADEQATTALYSAVLYKHRSIVQMLLAAGADPKDADATACARFLDDPWYTMTLRDAIGDGAKSQVTRAARTPVAKGISVARNLETTNSGGELPPRTKDDQSVPTILAFPDRLLKKALQLASQHSLDKNAGEALALKAKNKWDEALPRSLAAFFQSKDERILGEFGSHCYAAVLHMSKNARVTQACEDYMNCAIDVFSFLIPRTVTPRDLFAARGAMYFMKAQTDANRSLLDAAEADYKKALSFTGANTKGLSEGLEEIRQVRSRLR